MKKPSVKAVIAGTAAAAALGAVAGILLAPQSGKKTRKKIESLAGEFYSKAGPELKKLAEVGKTEYKSWARKAVRQYAKTKKLTTAESKALEEEAKKAWSHIKKKVK